MKIYQIHEWGGEWEDRYDYIVSSYLSKEKAEAERDRLEKEQAGSMKCNECPIYFCPFDCDGEDCGTEKCTERCIELVKKHCDAYEPSSTGKCENYRYNLHDSKFSIEEVEVIE